MKRLPETNPASARSHTPRAQAPFMRSSAAATHAPLSLLLFLLLALCSGPHLAHAEITSTELTAISKKITLKNGGKATLTLMAVDNRKRGFFSPGVATFTISGSPRCGTLGPIQSTIQAGNTHRATVLYEHNPDLPGSSDTVTFNARLPGQSSTVSGMIEIDILRPDLAAHCDRPGGLIRSTEGIPEILTVHVQNTGGEELTTTLNLTPPWKTEEPPLLQLLPKEKRTLHLTFPSEKNGSFTGSLSFEGWPRQTIPLKAEVTPGVQLTTGTLDFGRVPLGTSAERALPVVNLGGLQREIRAIATPPFTLAEASVTLPSRQKVDLLLRTQSLTSGTTTGTVQILEGTRRTTWQLTATFYKPAQLTVINPEILAFGNIPQKSLPQTNTLTLINHGEADWFGSAAVQPPFFLTTSSALSLPAGHTRQLPIRFSPGSASTYIKELLLTSNTETQRFEVSGTSLSPGQLGRTATNTLAHIKLRSDVQQNLLQLKGANTPTLSKFLQTKPLPEDSAPSGTLNLQFGKIQNLPNETSRISWRAGDYDHTGQFQLWMEYISYTNTTILSEWRPLMDVPCQKVEDGRFAFIIDRLQPSSNYRFAISKKDAAGRETGRTEPISVLTPFTKIQDPIENSPWRWAPMGVGLLILALVWYLKRKAQE